MRHVVAVEDLIEIDSGVRGYNFGTSAESREHSSAPWPDPVAIASSKDHFGLDDVLVLGSDDPNDLCTGAHVCVHAAFVAVAEFEESAVPDEVWQMRIALAGTVAA
jgi:hypothetical protein